MRGGVLLWLCCHSSAMRCRWLLQHQYTSSSASSHLSLPCSHTHSQLVLLGAASALVASHPTKQKQRCIRQSSHRDASDKSQMEMHTGFRSRLLFALPLDVLKVNVRHLLSNSLHLLHSNLASTFASLPASPVCVRQATKQLHNRVQGQEEHTSQSTP